MPVTVVPTSLATVAIDTFITELSSVIRNWPAARVSSTRPEPVAARSFVPLTWRRYAGRLACESSEPDEGAFRDTRVKSREACRVDHRIGGWDGSLRGSRGDC